MSGQACTLQLRKWSELKSNASRRKYARDDVSNADAEVAADDLVHLDLVVGHIVVGQHNADLCNTEWRY
jgi:hypothetical protein